MILCLLMMTMPLQETEPLLRVTYEVEITEGTRQVTARMVLNQLSKDRFSIHCAKGTSGTLFTYWATPDESTLYVPKSDLAFIGPAGEAFGLFPGGPVLQRTQWMGLLFAEPPDLSGGFNVADEAGWRLLRNREQALTIRWREKKRGQRKRYSKRVLHPSFKEGVRKETLARMPLYWEEP